MNVPIVFVSRNRIKPGMAEAFRQHYADSIAPIESGKPDTLVQFAYEDEAATEVIVIRLFHDATGLDRQLQGADERSKRTYEFIEPVGIEIYGTPTAYALERIAQIAGTGIVVRMYPHYSGGFSRF